MEKRERIAKYTACLPIFFEFKARNDLDIDIAVKMAQSYAELLLANVNGIKWDKADVDFSSRETIYTPEEIAERKKRFDEMFRGYTNDFRIQSRN